MDHPAWLWIVLRWVRDPKREIRPGGLRLLWWSIVAVGGFFALAFASGGHKASPPVELAAIVFILVLAGICVRWLWTLYVKIGVPRR